MIASDCVSTDTVVVEHRDQRVGIQRAECRRELLSAALVRCTAA